MSRSNPIDGFEIDPAALSHVGEGLQRPECILAEPDGSLWTADARGGVVHIAPDGGQRLIAQTVDTAFSAAGTDEARFTEGTLPNGLAFDADGSILVANFGTDRLERMTRTGETEVIFDKIDGAPIGKVNFVLRDSRGRLWLTISTRRKNWMTAVSPNVRDGYVAVADDRGLRIVAEGFAFPNECRFDADETWLYVAETTGPFVTRLRIAEDASVAERQIFGPAHHGAFIDGIAFDAFGNLWGTHIMLDHVFALTPEGELRIVLDDDRGSAEGAALMAAFAEDRVTTDLMLAAGGRIAPWMASLTFGGPDLDRLYIGSLRGTTLPWAQVPVRGLPLIHWNERRPG